LFVLWALEKEKGDSKAQTKVVQKKTLPRQGDGLLIRRVRRRKGRSAMPRRSGKGSPTAKKTRILGGGKKKKTDGCEKNKVNWALV